MPAFPNRAVFLSYASQDADAARRIAEGLKLAGAEVWFDQSELVGGDAWDVEIRRQIKECALFVPIISANTQARPEGYFRLEWHLAEQRTLLMAHDQPFVLPVVIDDTPDTARVPEKFRTVQWTRLPAGATTTAFQTRIRNLLGHEAVVTPSPGAPLPRVESNTGLQRRRRVFAAGAAIAAMIVAASYVAANWSSKSKGPPPLGGHSVAVLPFANMSDDRDNAFFADGLQEDILTNITPLRELRVVSRTTMLQYRDTKLSMRQLGQALGVAYILEGSVRGRGTRIRLAVQLINARTDEHVWAKSYDRDLSDVFATQTELSKEIADALHAVIATPN